MAGYNPVYSAQLILYTPSTPNLSFEVPEGSTAVIRQWSASQEISDWLFQLKIQNSVDAPTLIVVNVNQVGINTYLAGEGRWVVPGGGIISIYLSALGDFPNVYVGGYLLTNVAP